MIVVSFTGTSKAYLYIQEREVKMGSRNVCIWPAGKAVPLALILCSVALFFLPLFSNATTFVFKPTKQPAYYSDTANWVNSDYPGRQIASGDTITFEINSTFTTAIIDSNILVKGFCHIGDSVNWIIPINVTATFQRDISDGMMLQKIASASTSLVKVEGALRLYACNAGFDGITNVTGTIRADAEYNFIFGLWQTATFNDLSVSGSCTGTAVRMYCDSLFVDVGARVAISSGYAFNNGSLHADTIINKGDISLEHETQLYCTYLQNEGRCKAGSLSGKLWNTGSIELVQMPTNSFTADIWDVVNSGTVQIYGSVYAPILISGVNNTGIFRIGNLLNETSSSSWLNLQGQIFNSNLWIQSGNLNVAEMSGDYSNTGIIELYGKTNFNSGTFTNNGTCQFFNPTVEYGVLISNTFINNSNFTSYGRLEVVGQFKNYGTANVNE